jgi:hypothetical protein
MIRIGSAAPTALLMLSLSFFSGCGGTESLRTETVREDDSSPEHAYRQFMLVGLSADEGEILHWIVPNADASVLWENGPFSEEVAELLARQYQTMKISRVAPKGPGAPDQVQLESSAFPAPLAVRKIDGAWRVDAAPIIDIRKMNRHKLLKK